jgi:hypothetical protein
MAGHSRSKNGVASLAFVPAIHILLCGQDVDARLRGHDAEDFTHRICKPLALFRLFPTRPAFLYVKNSR